LVPQLYSFHIWSLVDFDFSYFCILYFFLKKSDINVDLKSTLATKHIEKDVVGGPRTSITYFLGVFAIFFVFLEILQKWDKKLGSNNLNL